MVLQVHDELLLEVAESGPRDGVSGGSRGDGGGHAAGRAAAVDLGVGRTWAEAH